MRGLQDYDFGYGYPSCIIVKDNIVISKHTLTPDIIHWLVKLIHRSNIERSIQHDVSEIDTGALILTPNLKKIEDFI